MDWPTHHCQRNQPVSCTERIRHASLLYSAALFVSLPITFLGGNSPRSHTPFPTLINYYSSGSVFLFLQLTPPKFVLPSAQPKSWSYKALYWLCGANSTNDFPLGYKGATVLHHNMVSQNRDPVPPSQKWALISAYRPTSKNLQISSTNPNSKTVT